MTTAVFPVLRKPADAQHPIHELIGERWSPRAFSDQPVERAALHTVFEAARWAASAGNAQPWNFVLGTMENPETHEKLAATLWEGNYLWAQHAPVLILVVAKLYPYEGKEQLSLYDTGMAVGNLVTQAVALGLTTHQMGGFDGEKARQTLEIPEGYMPVAMIALGYPGSTDALPDPLRERELAPRSRKPLAEFVFDGKWKKPADEVAA
ncbi:MAG TPA: nitroreductase family protein [Chloroflexota bacterium]|nr:nitroreductase family protein [Chloroflexota bacterium]